MEYIFYVQNEGGRETFCRFQLNKLGQENLLL